MKAFFRNLFLPLLNPFEQAEGDYAYVASHRWITLAVGALFSVITIISLYLLVSTQSYGAILPVLAFGTMAVVSLVIGLLGNDRAVAKVWNSRKQ